jgi:sensor domain CHASE-containing protein
MGMEIDTMRKLFASHYVLLALAAGLLVVVAVVSLHQNMGEDYASLDQALGGNQIPLE